MKGFSLRDSLEQEQKNRNGYAERIETDTPLGNDLPVQVHHHFTWGRQISASIQAGYRQEK